MFTNQFQKYDFPLLGLVRLPEIKIDNKEKQKRNLPSTISNIDFLAALVKEGYQKKRHKIPLLKQQEYVDRIDFELNLIEELSFTDYFLLVWMVINKVRELRGFCDFGRGSCAASIIFWLIGVTGVDPIDKRLLFARFISKVRAKKQVVDGIIYLLGELCPDVDLNLGGSRQQIVEWLKTIYPGKIAQIAAISTFTGKILIKDVYKIMDGASEEEAKRVADLIDKHFGIVEDISKMPQKSQEFKLWTELHPLTYKIALKLRDVIRQKSSHASGYLISYNELNGYVPLELNKDKELAVGYDMDTAAQMAIKLDLLGLTSNEIIKEIVDAIPERVEDINLDDDPLIYDQLQNNNLLPYGLYQISADCAYKAAMEIKPKNIFELSDVNAIARPGALAYLKGYVENTAPCPHPLFEQILKPTRNFCLYQEQAIQMAMQIGFSAEESELIRRCIGKKKIDEVKEWKQKIYDKVTSKNLPKEVGDLFWKIVDDSSKYQFNASHSLSTSYLTALTIYLKYKYPLQFYLACLRAAKKLPNPIDEISTIQKELHFFNIKLLPPHIIKSDLDFKIEGNNIRMGLGNIKGVAEKTIEKLGNFKNEYSNKFQIFKAANEAKISIGVLGSLIACGCLDDSLAGASRAKIMLESQLWNLLTDTEQCHCLELGERFNFDLIAIVKHLNKEARHANGKPIIKDSRYATIKKHYLPYLTLYNSNVKNEELLSYFFEKRLLGFSFSTNLLKIFQNKDVSGLVSLADTRKITSSREVFRVVGEVVDFKSGTGRESHNLYWRLCVQDHTDTAWILITNNEWANSVDEAMANNGRHPEKGDIIVAKCNKGKDILYGKSLGIQDIEIFMKIAELKNKTTDAKIIENLMIAQKNT